MYENCDTDTECDNEILSCSEDDYTDLYWVLVQKDENKNDAEIRMDSLVTEIFGEDDEMAQKVAAKREEVLYGQRPARGSTTHSFRGINLVRGLMK